MKHDGPQANLATAWKEVYRTSEGVPEVTVEWTRAHGAATRQVDVRGPEEFAGALGHVPGAALIPLGRLELEARAWDRGTPLVLICRSGVRSGRGALALESMGFERVASMAGGMIEWNERGYPTERG